MRYIAILLGMFLWVMISCHEIEDEIIPITSNGSEDSGWMIWGSDTITIDSLVILPETDPDSGQHEWFFYLLGEGLSVPNYGSGANGFGSGFEGSVVMPVDTFLNRTYQMSPYKEGKTDYVTYSTLFKDLNFATDTAAKISFVKSGTMTFESENEPFNIRITGSGETWQRDSFWINYEGYVRYVNP